MWCNCEVDRLWQLSASLMCVIQSRWSIWCTFLRLLCPLLSRSSPWALLSGLIGVFGVAPPVKVLPLGATFCLDLLDDLLDHLCFLLGLDLFQYLSKICFLAFHIGKHTWNGKISSNDNQKSFFLQIYQP